MQEEADITINGKRLSHQESKTVRVAIDTLANVLSEGLKEKEDRAPTELYVASLSRVQTLLESRRSIRQ